MFDILAFEFENTSIRVITEEQEPWFALIDICSGLDIVNPRKLVQRLDEDERRKFNLGGLEGETWFVNEAGLYHVILTSRSEKAKPFRRTVTHVILPAIRKNGYYSTMSDEELYKNPRRASASATGACAEDVHRSRTIYHKDLHSALHSQRGTVV